MSRVRNERKLGGKRFLCLILFLDIIILCKWRYQYITILKMKIGIELDRTKLPPKITSKTAFKVCTISNKTCNFQSKSLLLGPVCSEVAASCLLREVSFSKSPKSSDNSCLLNSSLYSSPRRLQVSAQRGGVCKRWEMFRISELFQET